MSARRETSRAFLLRSVDYGESDRILTLLTLDLGKMSVLARGARKSWRRFGGALEPFSLFEVTVASSQGRGRLWTLTEAHLLAAHEELATDLDRIGAASFVLEIVREMVPEHEPQHEIFALLEEVLPMLAKSTGPAIAAITLAVELRLLAMAGMGVSILQCNACGRAVPEERKVRFNPARGGIVCTPCGGGPVTFSTTAATALRKLATLPLPVVHEVTLGGGVATEIEGALNGFVDHHLGRPIRSRELFSAVCSK
ncbi:MAG: DNA repair protein RecO [Deltaproteobacteria bacterium]|nr:DNA repair protein RecO [Deltaproteobacteria bacterium]